MLFSVAGRQGRKLTPGQFDEMKPSPPQKITSTSIITRAKE